MRIAHHTRPMPGEEENGDGVLVLPREDGEWIGVVDGLGHGPKAAAARRVCVEALAGLPEGTGVAAAFDAAGEALRATRGVALTLVSRRGEILEAAGVGNVALRRTAGIVLPFVATPGIVGTPVRGLRVVRGKANGGRLVMHSDGISSRFGVEELAPFDPEGAVEWLFDRHASKDDDATALVVDYD